MKFNVRHVALIAAMATVPLLGAGGAMGAGGPLPDPTGLRISQPVSEARVPASIGATKEYVVTLTVPSVAKAYKEAGKLSKDQQKAQAQAIKAQQDAVASRVKQAGGRELARIDKAINALIVAIDSRLAKALEQDADVASVRAVNRYEIDLSDTVPYIGAAIVQEAGTPARGFASPF
jgi:hypothetical protein